MKFQAVVDSCPGILQHSQRMLDSWRQLLGTDLIDRSGNEFEQAKRLYELPAVVLCHDGTDDPRFNYANLAGQQLFEYDWQQFLTLHSRQSAELDQQSTRGEMLARARRDGFIRDYSGIRISASGHRFRISGATIWNVFDESGARVGQAATFDRWTNP